ncbi:MAG: hypothetical protein ACRDYU_05305 [Actinomycetes bacterium]
MRTTPDPLPTFEAAAFDPADFTTEIDNRYLPWTPGARYVYRGTSEDGTERVVVEVTDRTRTVMGVEAVVVRDTVTVDGELVEDTEDWYAQDAEGNVWYLGEDTTEFENGKAVSHAGAWEAGVDGAEPGIVMPAHPRVGQTYRQEYLEGEAEDAAEMLSLDEKVSGPTGAYDRVVMTKDYTPLEPDVLEHKLYAPGVGLVLEVGVSGGSSRVELVKATGL